MFPHSAKMSIICPESVSAKRKRIIVRELVQGQENATKLKFLLQNPINGPDGSLSAEELVANVLRSFTDTLAFLTSSEPEVAQNLLFSGEHGSPAAVSTNNPRSEESGESRKRSSPLTKDRSGCYKRRRTAETWTKFSHTTDDNHAWRKYGQKEILNSKFPRSYFRCSRKYDQGCRATKQVQRIQENPDMYQTTYIGFHTCKDNLKAPCLVTDSDTEWDSFLMNSSQVPSNDEQKDHPAITMSSQTPPIKQEYPKEDTHSELTDNMDPNLWSDIKDFELSKPAVMPLNTMASEPDNKAAHTDSQSLDMDFGVFSAHFSTDFQFDESQLL